MLDSIILSEKMQLTKDLHTVIFDSNAQTGHYPSPGVVLTYSRCNVYRYICLKSSNNVHSEIGQNSSTLHNTMLELIRENNFGKLQIAVEILKYQLSFFQAEKIFTYLAPLLRALNTVGDITFYLFQSLF